MHDENEQDQFSAQMTYGNTKENKNFVSHKEYGKSHMYIPVVSKREYSKFRMNTMTRDYFGNSAKQVVSFFAASHKISLKNADEIIRLLEEIKKEENE